MDPNSDINRQIQRQIEKDHALQQPTSSTNPQERRQQAETAARENLKLTKKPVKIAPLIIVGIYLVLVSLRAYDSYKPKSTTSQGSAPQNTESNNSTVSTSQATPPTTKPKPTLLPNAVSAAIVESVTPAPKPSATSTPAPKISPEQIDQQRRTDLETITQAAYDYALEHDGNLPEGIFIQWKQIGTASGNLDLSEVLAPYLPSGNLPYDPVIGSKEATGYVIYLDGNGIMNAEARSEVNPSGKIRVEK